MPHTEQALAAENLGPKYQHFGEFKKIQRSKLRGFPLSYTVNVICREAFLVDGSTPNLCVRYTIKGRMTHDWRGPIVVMYQPAIGVDPLFYEDVRAGDFRVAIDYFLSY